MTKEKVSITVDSDVIQRLMSKVDEGTFRNKSHAFEYAAKQYLAKQES